MSEKKSPKIGNGHSPKQKSELPPTEHAALSEKEKRTGIISQKNSSSLALATLLESDSKMLSAPALSKKQQKALILDVAVSTSSDVGADSTSDGIPEDFQDCQKAIDKVLRFMQESTANRALVLDRLAPRIKTDFVYCLMLQAQHYRISAFLDDVPDKKNTYIFAKIGKTANEDAAKILQMLAESSNSEILISDYMKQSRVSSAKSRFYSITNGLSKSRYVYTLKLCMFFPADDFLGQTITTESVTRGKLGLSLDTNWYRYINDGSSNGQNRIGVDEWVVTNGNMIERIKKFKSLYDFHRFNIGMPSDFKGRDIKIEVHKSSGSQELLFQRRWMAPPSTTRVGTPKSNRKEGDVKK